MGSEIKTVDKPGIFTVAHGYRAYKGRKGCMCGCKGTYYEAGTVEAEEILAKLRNASKVEIGKGVGEIYYYREYANGACYAIYVKE